MLTQEFSPIPTIPPSLLPTLPPPSSPPLSLPPSLHPSLPPYLPTYLSTYLPTYLPTYVPTYLMAPLAPVTWHLLRLPILSAPTDSSQGILTGYMSGVMLAIVSS